MLAVLDYWERNDPEKNFGHLTDPPAPLMLSVLAYWARNAPEENLENLTELNLYGTRISNAALNTLGQMESLKKLFLWNTRITAKAIADFKVQHPEIEVIAGL